MTRAAPRRNPRGCACIFDRDAKLAWPCAAHSSFSLPRGWIGCPVLGCINRGNARLVAAHLVYTHSWPAAHVALFLWAIFRLEYRIGIALPPFLEPGSRPGKMAENLPLPFEQNPQNPACDWFDRGYKPARKLPGK